jgi:hypothetical protein
MNSKLKRPALKLCAGRVHPPAGAEPFSSWSLPDGTQWSRFYRIEGGYLLRFIDQVDFRVTSDGLEVAAYPAGGVTELTIEHLFLNQVLPLALSRQFQLVVHAGAVEIPGFDEAFAVGFVGASGRGKSTLTASFATSGHRFLTDDGLQLEKGERGFLIRPSHASIRLYDDSREALMPDDVTTTPPLDYTCKLRLLADEQVAHCKQTRPLRALYFLGPGKADAPSIETVSGRDAPIDRNRQWPRRDDRPGVALFPAGYRRARHAQTPVR